MGKALKVILWLCFWPILLFVAIVKTNKIGTKPKAAILAIYSVLIIVAMISSQGGSGDEAGNAEINATTVAQESSSNVIEESADTSSSDAQAAPEVSAESDPAVVTVVDDTVAASEPVIVTVDGYTLLDVDGGDMSGARQSTVKVDVGFGDRTYWAYTNEYGQLVRVTAEKIVLQDDSTEPVNNDGRYYDDEAAVPGTERDDLDQGHVIADSLGGVSNAYNITPQDSTLNRHGNQAYMEDQIRKAGGCTNFEAIITYPDTQTQIPSHYHYTYTLKGNVITEDFDNVNPDEANQSLNTAPATDTVSEPDPAPAQPAAAENDISKIDTNNNGKVTISEAEAAGFKMPITKDHWLYQYMTDKDGDGVVGESN